MRGKKRTDHPRSRPDSNESRKENAMNRNQTNNSDRNSGEINRGNTRNTGYNQQSGELHTKKSVMGSDEDGQAE